MKKLLILLLIVLMTNNIIKQNKEYEIAKENKRLEELEQDNKIKDAMIGEYYINWNDEYIELSISKSLLKKIDKGETFEVISGNFYNGLITYNGETTKAHFTKYEDDLLLHIETNDGGDGLYYIELLSNGNLWMTVFDATYIPVIDDEFVMIRKRAE